MPPGGRNAGPQCGVVGTGGRVRLCDDGAMLLVLTKRLQVPARADAAWSLLGDTRAALGCVPGARIQPQSVGPRLQGTLTVRVGPANLVFEGWLERRLRDDATREQRWSAAAGDAAGGSKAELAVTLRVLADDEDEGCAIEAKAEVTIDGRAAALGQTALEAAAGQMFNQFGSRFVERARIVQGRLPARQPAPAVEPGVSSPAPAAPVAPPEASAVEEVVPAPAPAPAEAVAPHGMPDGEGERADAAAGSPWQRFVAWLRRLFGA